MEQSGPSTAFTWNPADYHKNSPAQHQWAQELIGKLKLTGKERILDVGCGDGKVTIEIARHVSEGKVTGVDNSSEMIQFACDHFPRAQFPNLSFMKMDARALSFSEEFDVVFSSSALHWITDHKPVLAGIAQSLLPAGRLLIQMGGKGNAATIFDVMDVQTEKSRWNQYFEGFLFTYGFFGSDEYQPWLKEAGFEPIRVDLIPKDMIYSTRQDFAAWIRTTWLPWMTRIPEEEQSGFIEEFIDEYLLRYPVHADGKIHIQMVRLEVEAKKRV